MNKYYLKKFLIYLSILSLAGCTPISNNSISTDISTTDSTSKAAPSNISNLKTTSLLELSNSIQEKYASQDQYHFSDDVYTLDRNEVLEIDLGFPITGEHNTYDMFQFFLDPELTIPLWRPAPTNYYKGYHKVKIKPKTYPLFRTEFEEESVRENANWGNAGTLYLAKYYDKTGHITKEPQEVSIIKIRPELPMPNVTLTTDSNGFATLTWQPVEGATQYGIYSISLKDNQVSGDEILYCVATTKETSFSDFDVWLHDSSHITGRSTNNILSINDDFIYKENGYSDGYVVIAEGANGKSEMSKVITPNDYASMLINMRDYDFSTEEIKTDQELQLPLYLPIKMCDGTSVLYPIEYDASSVQKYTGEYSPTVQVEGKGLAQRMTIIGRPKGTPFEEVFYFYYYPEIQSIEQTLSSFLDRQKRTTSTPSGLGTNMLVETASETENTPTDTTSSISINEAIPITATNPLSEYLAYNMLNGATHIPLKDFPIASDTTYLSDAIQETIAQNPLILGIDSITSYPYINTLAITYTFDTDVQQRRQQQVLEEANNIIASIITSDMNDLEKEEAINNYLCTHLEYDFDALESAEKNDYTYADPEFDDSFTVYGALINKVCVCKGYAEAFKLLCDLAGVDSLVVLGQMESIGHAWNKVKINDEWLSIDVTNNDKDILGNALFNLPDETAKLLLVENKEYILDANYKDYTSSSLDFEYYRLKDSYYPKTELAQAIATQLTTASNTFTLRTDFNISDDELYTLLEEAITLSDFTKSFKYYNWLGVIHIESD